MFLVILLFAMFASLFTLQKETLLYSQPFFLVGSRMLVAGLILLAYLAIRHRHTFKQTFKIKLSHVSTFILLAISNIYLTNIFEIWGIQHMVSSKACLIYSLSPFLAALVAFMVLGEVLSPYKWLGMLIGFFGLIPIHFAQTGDEVAAGSFWVFSLAELSMVAAVFFSVYGWTLLKKLIANFKHSPLLANAVSMTIGGILALLHSYYAGEPWQPIPVTDIQPFIINSLIMCLISNIICYNLYGYLLKRFTATFMSFAGLITPFFASLYGYFFLQEVITWHFYVAISMFTLGLFIFYNAELKQGEGFKQNLAATTNSLDSVPTSS